MKKSALLLLAFFTTTLAFAQNGSGNGKNENGNENPGGPRTNQILPHGNVGIGTLTPEEKLHVVGNVLISDRLTASEISSVGLSATNLSILQDVNVGRNLLIDGNVGIGVANPSDKLEIAGNLRVSNTIFTNGFISNTMTVGNGSVTTDFSVGNLFTVSGNTGLGVINPTERLEVAGNAVISQGLRANTLNFVNGTASSDLNIGNNLFVTGNTGLGVENPAEKLEVAGNAAVTGEVRSATLKTGQADLSESLKVAQNAIVMGNMGIGIENPTEKMDIAGNLKASGSLTSASLQTGTASLSGDLTVATNTYLNGNVGIGTETPSEKLDVTGNIKASGTVMVPFVQTSDLETNNFTTKDFTADKGTFTQSLTAQDIAVMGKLGIGIETPAEKLHIDGNIQALGLKVEEITTNSLTNNNSLLTESLQVTADLRVVGSAHFLKGFRADGVVETQNIRTNALAAENLRVSKELKVDGTLSANEMTLQRINGVAGNPLVVNAPLAVNAESVPEGYQMAVNGAIMTTAVEVRYFDEWPDYVFEGDYRLRSLEEVDAFVKENGHLPEVPSAAQINEKGYSVTDMDAALLKKVEELTLYMIELKKENQKLRTEVDELKARR